MANQIKIENLKKTFSSNFMLNISNLCLLPTSPICLFGVNGSGKSTFFRLLTGDLEADSGAAFYDQEKMLAHNFLLKRKIGYLPQESQLPNWATPIDLLKYASLLHCLPEETLGTSEILSYWDCLSFAKTPISLCSHGMQKRVGLALASFHNPKYLILDEPFAGLDLKHTLALEDLIKKRGEQGRLTLISTHIVPYAAELCEQAYIMASGKIHSLSSWSEVGKEKRVQLVKEFFRNKSEK